MKIRIYTFISCILLITTNVVTAQRFGGGLKIAGILSQIDGDDAYGFHKAGLEAGVYGSVQLSKIMDIEINFSYSQRGSRSTNKDLAIVKFDLIYLDVPILLVIKDWLNETGDKNYYRMHFFGGLSIGRLISSKSLTGVDQDFKKTDVSWLVGTSYFWAPNWAGTAKYTHSLAPLYEYNNGGRQTKMISYFISLGLNYKFN